eukprot:CAMPEP_0184491216 /NCGR_PEP_ID=MMETSP0113_2-20130426/19853_1 /TAXON_ID=91329 /ORGANISM="Norrisiella sphaerica, Strain BC52" /LENGTH=282 /DNA_ID=CAMNT_0026875485 /DNA_START=271 /DNA_END=1119 /DNA_ORIENTATION=+
MRKVSSKKKMYFGNFSHTPSLSVETDSSWEALPEKDKWAGIPTKTETSHDYDPDTRGPPVKTPNADLQRQLDIWVKQLEAITASNDTDRSFNSTRFAMLIEFCNNFMAVELGSMHRDQFAKLLLKNDHHVADLLKNLRRCATGQGVRRLLDKHLSHAGFELWELESEIGDQTLNAFLKKRYKMLFALHEGVWRLPAAADFFRKGVIGSDGEEQIVGHIYSHADYKGKFSSPEWSADDFRPKHVPKHMFDKYKDWYGVKKPPTVSTATMTSGDDGRDLRAYTM